MARLSKGARSKLKSSTFGLPGKRAYPMPDQSHAKFAKAMASKHATPAQKAKIDAKANRVLGK